MISHLPAPSAERIRQSFVSGKNDGPLLTDGRRRLLRTATPTPDKVWKEWRDDIDWLGRECGNFQGLIGEREIASVYRVGPPSASFLGGYFKDASLHQLV